MKRLICLFRGHSWGPVTRMLDCDDGQVVLEEPCVICGKPKLLWAYGTASDGGWKIEGQFIPNGRRSFIRRLDEYGVDA